MAREPVAPAGQDTSALAPEVDPAEGAALLEVDLLSLVSEVSEISGPDSGEESGSDLEAMSPAVWRESALRQDESRRHRVTFLPACTQAVTQAWDIIDGMDRCGTVSNESLRQLKTQVEHYEAAVRTAQEGGAEVPQELRDRFDLVRKALESATQLARSSVYSKVRRLESRGLGYESAARALEAVSKDLLAGQVPLRTSIEDFRRQADEVREQSLSQDPAQLEDVAGPTGGASSWKVRVLRSLARAGDRFGLVAPRNWVGLAAAQKTSGVLFKADEKALVRAVVAALVAARKAHPHDPLVRRLPVSRWDRWVGNDKAFARKYLSEARQQALQCREVATVANKLQLKLPPGQGLRRYEEVTCSQTPASTMTDALAASYAKDGIHLSPCHDFAQAQHARSLFHSEMHDSQGRRVLSLVRHGVLSASAFTRDGVKKVSAEVLGKAAKQLRPDMFRHTSAIAVGERLKGLAGTLHGETLLEDLRQRANANAAQEVLAASMASLPVEALQRIHDREEGELPVVRLASVSALTPDAIRDGATDGERRMWADQYAALSGLRGEQRVRVPLVQDGVVRRDEQGRAITVEEVVEVELAAFNFPVNDFANNELSTFDAFSGWETAKPQNDEAMEMLLGKDFRAKAGSSDWRPGGWLGEALGPEADWSSHARRLFELSKQVAVMYTTNDYVGLDKDPYAMVERLLVLAHHAGGATLLNCKSGKDRTTMAETNARDLAFTLLQEDMDVPKQHQRSSDPTAAARMWTLHQGGGGHEVQAAAAGLAGTKLHIAHNFEACGFHAPGADAEAMITAFTGGSWQVKS